MFCPHWLTDYLTGHSFQVFGSGAPLNLKHIQCVDVGVDVGVDIDSVHNIMSQVCLWFLCLKRRSNLCVFYFSLCLYWFFSRIVVVLAVERQGLNSSCLVLHKQRVAQVDGCHQ